MLFNLLELAGNALFLGVLAVAYRCFVVWTGSAFGPPFPVSPLTSESLFGLPGETAEANMFSFAANLLSLQMIRANKVSARRGVCRSREGRLRSGRAFDVGFVPGSSAASSTRFQPPFLSLPEAAGLSEGQRRLRNVQIR